MSDFDFDDDIALLAENHPVLQEMESGAAKTGLKINNQRTKVMQVESDSVKVGREPIEEVTIFTYLGSVVTSNSDAETDVSCRISCKVVAVFRRLTKN